MGELQKANSYGYPLKTEVVNSPAGVGWMPVIQANHSAHPLIPPASLFSDYLSLISRHRRMIAFFTVVGAIVGFLITVGQLPVYRARTSLDIQNLNADFMNMREVAPTAGSEGGISSEAYVQTQIKLLQSETLRERTVKRMMTTGPTSESLNRDDLLSMARRKFHLPNDQPVSKAELLKETARNVLVKPLGTTRLVEVTCDSWNATVAAEFCNALTNEFSEQDHEVRWNEAQKTGEWLSRQMADVREHLSRSEKKLEAATGADAMVLHHGGDTVSAEKLEAVQADLMKAQSERVSKQAQYETSRNASPNSLPMILDNGEFREYETRLSDLRRQVAALVPPLTEANPKVQHLRAQITEMEKSVTAKKRDLMQRMKNEYQEAKQRESLLNNAYRVQEKKVAEEQKKEAQVSMLRHDVESEQQIYQNMLQKVKEAGFASAMQASTMRVVDAAKAPDGTILPRRGVCSMVGMLLGMFAGIGLAFTKERTESVLRAPGEVTRYLALRELGTIPSCKKRGNSPLIDLKERVVGLMGAGSNGKRPKENVLDLSMWKDNKSLVTEAFRSATYSILLSEKDSDRANLFVISSPNISEGKTTVTCNLGFALAQANRRVLLIDGDLRKPSLHRFLGVSNDVGFRDLLLNRTYLDDGVLDQYCRPTMLPNLWVIPSGHGGEDSVSLLHSRRCKQILDFLVTQFDVILIDSPPMLHMADARIFGGMVSGAILVFRSRVTNREAAASARDLFLNDRVKVIGTILNDFDPSREGKNRYYDSYYAYHQRASTVTEDVHGRDM